MLKEFDLYAPALDHNRRTAFHKQTRCVTALVERCFKGKIRGCWKVMVECVPSIKNSTYRDLLGAYTIELDCDAEHFFSLTNEEKKLQTFEWLRRGVERVVAQAEWDAKPFEEAFNAVEALQLVNEWKWKSAVKNKSKEMSAYILCKHDVDSFDAFAVIHQQNGLVIGKQKLFSEVPDEWAFAEHFGSLEWIDNNTVVLFDKKRVKSWKVDAAALVEGSPKECLKFP